MLNGIYTKKYMSRFENKLKAYKAQSLYKSSPVILFAFPDEKPLHKGLLLKNKNLLLEEQILFFLRVEPYLEAGKTVNDRVAYPDSVPFDYMENDQKLFLTYQQCPLIKSLSSIIEYMHILFIIF